MIKKNNNIIITKKQCSDVEALCVEISPYITSPSFNYKPTHCLWLWVKGTWKFRQFALVTCRSSYRTCSIKKGCFRNSAKAIGKHFHQSLFFNKVACITLAILFKKETVAQKFSCEFCEIFKNTFFTEYLRAAVSAASKAKLIHF